LEEQPRTLSEPERAAIRRLATDIPALWAAPTTTDADRKELIRQVVERVVVQAQGPSERVWVQVDWMGGEQTQGMVRRPIRQLADLSGYPQICERVRTWTQQGVTAAGIAVRLHQEGYQPPRGERFGPQAVRELRRRLGLRGYRRRGSSRAGLGPDEWWRSELTQTLGIPVGTLGHWIQRGWVRARQEPHGLRRWIVWADAAELERLRELHQRPVDDTIRQRWFQQEVVNHVSAS
jgi:hypothetical protein